MARHAEHYRRAANGAITHHPSAGTTRRAAIGRSSSYGFQTARDEPSLVSTRRVEAARPPPPFAPAPHVVALPHRARLVGGALHGPPPRKSHPPPGPPR